MPQPTPKAVTFGKIMISSPDEHLPSAWNVLCDKVVTALEAAYEYAETKGFTGDFDTVGNEGDGIKIVLENNLSKNWEVKAGTKYGTLHIKTGSISSITAANYASAMESVIMNLPDSY